VPDKRCPIVGFLIAWILTIFTFSLILHHHQSDCTVVCGKFLVMNKLTCLIDPVISVNLRLFFSLVVPLRLLYIIYFAEWRRSTTT
jgi:hypothetical protein